MAKFAAWSELSELKESVVSNYDADYWNNYDFSQGGFEIERLFPFDKGVVNLNSYVEEASLEEQQWLISDEGLMYYLLSAPAALANDSLKNAASRFKHLLDVLKPMNQLFSPDDFRSFYMHVISPETCEEKYPLFKTDGFTALKTFACDNSGESDLDFLREIMANIDDKDLSELDDVYSNLLKFAANHSLAFLYMPPM